jgi:hypothetical protein
MKAKV